MAKRVYDFATIGFRPHVETEEFVTIGVVALDTAARHFGFRLLGAKRTRRISSLFPDLDRALYKDARGRLEKELEGIAKAVNGEGPGHDVPLFPVFKDKQRGLFAAITSPREGVVCYPVKGRRMADTMDDVLDALEARFIERAGLSVQQAAEQQMTKALRKVLAEARVLRPYKRDVRIGPEEFQVHFSFAHLTGEHRADRAIRPLNFDLPTSTDIYNHGDEWTQRLRRLKRFNYRPNACFLALRRPTGDDPQRITAFEEIEAQLRADDFEIADEHDVGKIVDFARIPEPKNLRLAGG